MYYEVIPTKFFQVNGDGILTYHTEGMELLPGQIVAVPLGKSTIFAVVVRAVDKPDFSTRPISYVVYDTPLPAHILKAVFWLEKYYLCSLSAAVNLFLPANIPKKVTDRPIVKTAKKLKLPLVKLNAAQKTALEQLQSIKTATKLLHGVTGSGKTNIYLELTAQTLGKNQSVILLVPEIALTSQLVQIFEQTFGQNTVLIHSNMTEKTRRTIWENILRAKTPQVIIGPRSALTMPVSNLGLIIIDESHESAYFQENSPKYSALRLASFMANTLGITCLQGTATPLISDFFLAKKQNAIVTLSKKAKTTAINPKIEIIDLKDRANFSKNRYFSDQLLASITENLVLGHQTLIFHNRRGSAPLTICEECGWQALCPNCFLPLALHNDQFQLLCHACGHTSNVPQACLECKNPSIIHKGFGTKLLETELNRLLKNQKTAHNTPIKIARFDADNKKAASLSELYQNVKSGDIDIIIGTQTIARGLDLPHLATVGIVQADAGLSLPDYAAEERNFFLLTQVMGRVGRGHLEKANVIIQTYKPEHPVITFATTADYQGFSEYLLKARQKSHFPPYYHLAKLSLTYKTENTVFLHLKTIRAALSKHPSLYVSAPMPAFHERKNTGFTWQLMLRANSRQTILDALKSLPKNPHLHFIIDPPSML